MTQTAREFEASSYLTGANAPFIIDLYERYLADPRSVADDWRDFFDDLDDSAQAALADLSGPDWAPRATRVVGNGGVAGNDGAAAVRPAGAPATPASDEDIREATRDSIRALILIRSYRVRGHLLALLDPLGIEQREDHPELDYETYGFTPRDLDRRIFISNYLGLGETATLREIIARCKATYAGTIGVEFMHIQDPDQKTWLQARIEAIENRTEFTTMGKKAILGSLVQAEIFERFLDRKYTGTKRFGLDGSESTVPALEQIIKRGGQLGVEEIVVGMPHRGRLNVLANMMGKPYQAIFSEFQGNAANPEDVQGSGDVKYHLGTSSDRDFDGKPGPSLAHRQPLPSGGGQPGRLRQGARQADPARRQGLQDAQRPAPGDGAAVAWRRRLLRPGRGGGDPRPRRSERLPHRRHNPFYRQQPDRLHHQPGAQPLRPLLHRVRQDRPGADLPCERRRSGSGRPCRPHRHGVPRRLPDRCRDRHVLLPAARP